MQLAAPHYCRTTVALLSHYCHTTVTLVRALQAMKRMSAMQRSVTAYTYLAVTKSYALLVARCMRVTYSVRLTYT